MRRIATFVVLVVVTLSAITFASSVGVGARWLAFALEELRLPEDPQPVETRLYEGIAWPVARKDAPKRPSVTMVESSTSTLTVAVHGPRQGRRSERHPKP